MIFLINIKERLTRNMIPWTLAVLSGLILASCSLSRHQASKDAQAKDRVEELIARLDEKPNPSHADYPPAVVELSRLGLPSLKYGVLDLLLSPDYLTRKRADAVLAEVTSVQLGISLAGSSNPERVEAWKDLWGKNGSYDPAGSEASRRASYKKWRRWLEDQN
jgi:hypothetical protein